MKETILIVHGTFAAPVSGKPTWYQPGSDFCRELDEQLALRGSSARCWAHLEECGEELRKLANRGTTYFSWSGKNSWLDRSNAARQLEAEIKFLHGKGWQWHIVAHSHGGNIALEFFDLDTARGGLAGNAVLLGTPIFSYSRTDRSFEAFGLDWLFAPFPLLKPAPLHGRGPRTFRIILGVSTSLVLWAYLVFSIVSSSTVVVGGAIFWLIACAVIAFLGFGYWYLRFLGTRFLELGMGMPRFDFWAGLSTYPPRTLFISSERDEAYCFLANVTKTANPWSDNFFTKAAFLLWLRAITKRAIELDAVRFPWGSKLSALWVTIAMAMSVVVLRMFSGVAELPWGLRVAITCSLLLWGLAALVSPGKVLCALAAPWRIVEASWLLLQGIFERIGVGYARRNAWKTVQAVALGLSGSPHRLSDVSVAQRPEPEFGRGAFLYEPLAKTAEAMAIAERKRFGHDLWDRATQLGDAELWNIEHWPETIGMIASDPYLVHTVYYRHPDVIGQIAKHLLRSAEDLLQERKNSERLSLNR